MMEPGGKRELPVVARGKKTILIDVS